MATSDRARRRRRRRRPFASLVALVVLAPWLIWAVVRVAGLDVGYPWVAALSFTPYVAATSVVPLLVALLLRRRGVAVLALATVVAFAAVLVPRRIDDADAAGGGAPVVVMSQNMLRGGADAEEIVALVRREGVDVLALQELTPQAVRRLDAAGLREELPNRTFDARRGAAGSGLATRLALSDRGDLSLPQTAAQPEGTVALPGAPGRLRVTVVHPPPPVSAPQTPIWRAGLAALPGGDERDLLVGDFNATLDHPAFRDLLARGWTDAAATTGDGWTPTWRQTRYLPLTIDHVLTADGIRAQDVRVFDVPRSDHRAVVAELVVGP